MKTYHARRGRAVSVELVEDELLVDAEVGGDGGIPGDGEVVVRLRLHLRDGLPVDRDDARALVVVDVLAHGEHGQGAMKSLGSELGPDLLHVLVGRGEDLDHPASRSASLRIGLPSSSRKSSEVEQLANTTSSEVGLALERDDEVARDASPPSGEDIPQVGADLSFVEPGAKSFTSSVRGDELLGRESDDSRVGGAV